MVSCPGELLVLQFLAAIVLIAHGIGHSIGFLGPWFGVYAGTTEKPWILPGARPFNGTAGKTWGALWLGALMLFVVSGVGVFMDETWWRTPAIVGSLVSIVATVPWWNTVLPGAKAGVALDVAILLVLLLPFGEDVTEFFEAP